MTKYFFNRDFAFNGWILSNMGRLGFTAEGLANLMQISPKTVYRHISGEQKPSLRDVISYCWIFHQEDRIPEIMRMIDPDFKDEVSSIRRVAEYLEKQEEKK